MVRRGSVGVVSSTGGDIILTGTDGDIVVTDIAGNCVESITASDELVTEGDGVVTGWVGGLEPGVKNENSGDSCLRITSIFIDSSLFCNFSSWFSTMSSSIFSVSSTYCFFAFNCLPVKAPWERK